MRSPNIKYVPEVDHLRAVAALLIVAYHGQQLFGAMLTHGRAFDYEMWPRSPNPLAALLFEGHTAVALFMTLSGFIFTYGAAGGRVDYGAFLINRLLRIYPLYMAVMLAGIAFYPANFRADQVLASVLPFANVSGLSLGPMSGMFWAIAVEFQFYLLFPFLLPFIRDRPLRHTAQIIAVSLALRALGVALGANPRDLSYFHLIGRIDQFVLGMAAALAMRAGGDRRPSAGWWPLAAGTATLAVLFTFHALGGWPSLSPWKIVWPLVEGVMWALFIAAYVTAGDRWPAPLSRLICRIGQVSFSTYLLHFPIITAVIEWRLFVTPTGRPSWDAALTTALVAMPLTLVLSALTFATIEAPFLALRRRYLRTEGR